MISSRRLNVGITTVIGRVTEAAELRCTALNCRRMRIFLVNDRFGADGGSEVVLSSLITALRDRGHALRLCVSSIAADAPRLPADVEIAHVPWRGIREESDPRAGDLVHQAAAAFQPDVVYAHNVFDHSVVRVLQSWPFVWHSHDHRVHCLNGNRRYRRSGTICSSSLGSACVVHAVTEQCGDGPNRRTLELLRLRKTLLRALRGSDGIVVFGAYLKRVLQANGFAPDQVLVVPPLIRYWDLAEQPAYPPPRVGKRTIVFAGRLIRDKGVDDVLWLGRKMIESGLSARVVVAGSGPLRSLVIDAAQRPDSGIEYRGECCGADLSQLFAEASVVVVPSRWPEPFGLAGPEALLHGRPVVAYRVGGIADWLIDGVNGIAVECGARAALFEAVRTLLETPALAAAMGEQGATMARERYAPAASLDALEHFLTRAIARFEVAHASTAPPRAVTI